MADGRRLTVSRLWTCPRCGHRFVTPNLAHSCGRFRLEDHFRDKETRLRATFRLLVRSARTFGPVTVYAQKTRIVFMVRVRFASIVVRRRWLDLGLWLTHPIDDPRVRRVERLGPRIFYTHLQLAAPGDVDDRLSALLGEAYRTGRQHHLQNR
jgi:hypothetical protein